MIWLIAAIVLSLSLKAEEKVFELKFVLANIVDYCDDDNRFTVIVDMGEVLPEDSLYLYQFAILYDAEHLQITSFLTANTLSRFFETDVKYGVGEVYGSVGSLQFGAPSSGNLPLFGLSGRFSGDCLDTGKIHFRYFEFSEEFHAPFDISDTLNITAEIIPNNSDIISLVPDSTSYHFTDDTLKTISITPLFTREVNEFTGVIEIVDKVNYEIKDFYYLPNSSVSQLDFEIENGLINFTHSQIDFQSGDLKYYLEIVAKNEKPIKDTDISFFIENNADCNCLIADDIVNSKIRNSYEKVENSIKEYDNLSVKVSDNTITIQSEKLINNIEVYDFLGNHLSSKSEILNNTSIPIGAYATGIYFLKVTFHDNNEIKIISIFKF